MKDHPYIVAISGASGSIYGVRLIKALVELNKKVLVILSNSGLEVLSHEMGYKKIDGKTEAFKEFLVSCGVQMRSQDQVEVFYEDQMASASASGSFIHCGMVVVPCSMKTLSAISSGFADTLLTRSADVCLKERRPLILVPRETPYNLIHLENMTRAHQAGAVILAPSPSFYGFPKTIEDLVDTVVARILDHLKISHDLLPRWEFVKKSFDKQTIRYLLDTLRENEFKVYLVGGAVRDAMLKRVPQDVDLLTNATPREIACIFRDQNVKIVGRAFPVCMVNGIEIASADKDSSHFPASDLARRDFTFNAMACDFQDKKIIDPFNGRDDLLNGLVRFTKDPEKRIKEDPVRMIRACRFLAMIEGTFADSTFEAIRSLADLLDQDAAKERIGHEIIKAMAVRKPSLFFEALHATGILNKIFPSLDRCYDLDGGPHHGETVFEHCMLVGDALPASMPILRLAGFLHDTGKFDAAKIKDGHLTFAGHEKHDQALIRDLENLRFSVRQIEYIKALTRSHMRPLTDESTPKAVRRLLAMLKDYHLEYPDFMRMRIADRKGNLAKPAFTMSQIRERLKKLFDEINSKAVFTINDLEISGRDIIRITGKTAGPEIGKIKHHLFKKVLDDPDLNTTENLKQLLATIDEQSYKGLT